MNRADTQKGAPIDGRALRPHEDVRNQPPELSGYNTFESDRALTEALEREGGAWALDRARAAGSFAGGEGIRLGFEANENKPKLKAFDRFGHRIDEVAFHPAYHALMTEAMAAGAHSLPWTAETGGQVARAAIFTQFSQIEAGHGCPISMTTAAVPALREQPDLAERWEPGLTAGQYDPRPVPWWEKSALTCGMAMTEKQGGSDVRANITQAVPTGNRGPGGTYEITGHKWFCSAPMCDAFLVLAHTDRGLSCFLLPRFRPDGSRNRFHIQRLKDKLGNWSNASSEVEFHGAYAQMLGEEGRGVPTIINMVHQTRLDCVLGVTALARQAVAQATHHCHYRAAFGLTLDQQPLMQSVLADLAVESEAMTQTMMRLAGAFDRAKAGDAEAQAFARLAVAVIKYWQCKRVPGLVHEALECHGGTGYVEESILPRLYREAPLNGIWEGSGNVMCLDVLRAMTRTPDSVAAFRAEIDPALGADPRLDRWVGSLVAALEAPADFERRARQVVERMALALQAAILVRFAPTPVAEAFCALRLGDEAGLAYGAFEAEIDAPTLIERARPTLVA